MVKDVGLIEVNGEFKVFIDQNFSFGKGVVFFVVVYFFIVNLFGKQFLLKIFGQFNVNIVQ